MQSEPLTISPRTEVYCVIGSPVAHSLSPLMHNTAFREIGYDAVYTAFDVGDISAAVSGIKGLGIRGASVTLPHKVSIIPLLDELDDTSRKIGAVNTLVWREGRLTGGNTDYLGAIRALSEKTDIEGKETLIVGAGGAARAIGFGIAQKKGKSTITNRTPEKGRHLSRDLHVEFSSLSDALDKKWDIIINTTSVGMTPNTDSIPVPESILRPGCVVMDIVYNPVETLLLKKATEKGCLTVDGVAMFVYQGVCQFELWTGREAPIAAMDQAVRTALKAKKQ